MYTQCQKYGCFFRPKDTADPVCTLFQVLYRALNQVVIYKH